MIRGDLLIDGYNLLHAAGLARRSYGPGEFERCRGRLLNLLNSRLRDRERRRTTVVFDAPPQTLGPSPPRVVHEMRVIFAGGSGDADEAIEQLIRQNSAPRRLHVISSDHRLQRAARRRRAKFFDSEDFLTRIIRRPTREDRAVLEEPAEKREGLTSAREIEAWLSTFSDCGPTSHSAAQPADSHQPEAPQQPKSSTAEDPPEPAREDTDELRFWKRRIAELEQDQDRQP